MSATKLKSGPVLIVGGGPTGLVMAIELARRQIQFRIIDLSREISEKSKAIGIQARTLELFEASGFASAFTAVGKSVVAANVFHGSRKLAQLNFSDLESPFPYILMLPQNETENILVDQLEKLGGSVERGTILKSFFESADCITATLEKPDGDTEVVETPWLIGCDGAHSTVRDQLNIPFLGEQYAEGFQLADVKILWLLKDDEIYVFVHDGWLIAAFPLPDGHHRLIADMPPELAPLDSVPSQEHWQKLLDDRLPVRATISEPRWSANYRIHRRLATQLKVGRAFLVGDAAHIHSPAGAQGMNTGIQDSYNLAWKLAAVEKCMASERLLESYHDERYPVEKSVLAATDLPLHVFGLTNPIAQAVRDRIVPLLAGMEVVQQKVRSFISEMAVQYSNSPIVEDHAVGGGPRAGERAPSGTLRDNTGTDQSLFSLLAGIEHKLLIFDPLRSDTQQKTAAVSVADAVRRELVGNVRVYTIAANENGSPDSFTDPGNSLHERYGARRGAVYLIRPDGYIGFRCPLASAPERLQEYLSLVYQSPN